MIDDPKPSVKKITDVTKILICILVFLLLLILKKIVLAISELKFMITNLLASVVPLLLFFFFNLCGSRAFSILFYFNMLQFSFCRLDCFYVTVSIQQHCCKHFYMSK